MCSSKAEGSKPSSNEVSEVEVRFESDVRRCEHEFDEEIVSSEVSFWSFMFEFRILCLIIFDVDSNLEFFRWMKVYSNESLNTDMEDEQLHELEASEIELLPSFLIKKKMQ